MLLEGTVINGTIVLDGNERLPEGARVEVAVKAQQFAATATTQEHPKAASQLAEGLMKLAGTAVGLPEDMAAQHDHYLHGTPKR
jgi:hypothetical protein